MDAKRAKELASRIMGVGEGRVIVDPQAGSRIKEAMTKEDLRLLIKERIISRRAAKGHSRAGANALAEKKKKGRRKGPGKRKGTEKARSKAKKSWIGRVRSQRKKLAELRKEAKEKGIYSKAYNMIKGSFFRSKKHLEEYIKGDSGKDGSRKRLDARRDDLPKAKVEGGASSRQRLGASQGVGE